MQLGTSQANQGDACITDRNLQHRRACEANDLCSAPKIGKAAAALLAAAHTVNTLPMHSLTEGLAQDWQHRCPCDYSVSSVKLGFSD